jgi:hypothetical protein
VPKQGFDQTLFPQHEWAPCDSVDRARRVRRHTEEPDRAHPDQNYTGVQCSAEGLHRAIQSPREFELIVSSTAGGDVNGPGQVRMLICPPTSPDAEKSVCESIVAPGS